MVGQAKVTDLCVVDWNQVSDDQIQCVATDMCGDIDMQQHSGSDVAADPGTQKPEYLETS